MKSKKKIIIIFIVALKLMKIYPSSLVLPSFYVIYLQNHDAHYKIGNCYDN